MKIKSEFPSIYKELFTLANVRDGIEHKLKDRARKKLARLTHKFDVEGDSEELEDEMTDLPTLLTIIKKLGDCEDNLDEAEMRLDDMID